MEILLEHLGNGFMAMLLISMPVVLVAAAIGLVIGILQAVTQVQEQTIAAAPKIIGVFLVIMIMGGFFSKILMEYLVDSITLGTQVIPRQEEFVLPPGAPLMPNDKDFMGGKNPPTNEDLLKEPGKVPYWPKQDKLNYTRSGRNPNPQPNFAERGRIGR